MSRLDGAEMGQEVIRWINGATQGEIAEFVAEVTNEHRTLQQKFFGAIMNCLQKWSADFKQGPGHYDGRNEFTCRKSAEILERVEDMDASRPPFI